MATIINRDGTVRDWTPEIPRGPRPYFRPEDIKHPEPIKRSQFERNDIGLKNNRAELSIEINKPQINHVGKESLG